MALRQETCLLPRLETVRLTDTLQDEVYTDKEEELHLLAWWCQAFERVGVDLQDGQGVVWAWSDEEKSENGECEGATDDAGERGKHDRADDISSADKGPPSADKGSSSADKGSSSANKGSSSADKGISSAEKGPSTDKGLSSADKGPSSVVESTIPAVEATSSAATVLVEC